jgi:hypothetical protein
MSLPNPVAVFCAVLTCYVIQRSVCCQFLKMSGQTEDEDLYLTFMTSMRSSEKKVTKFWEEQADLVTITMIPPTQHSATVIFL